jgi:putative salt-induced outer membrane protein YdiY
MKLLICIFLFCLSGFAFPAGAFAAFSDESELGVAIVGGNSSTETYNAKQTNVYEWDRNVAKGNFRYLNTKVGGTDTARSWDGSLRYEREFSDVINGFTSYGLESDVFAGYVQRNNFDLGVKYFFSKSEETKWFAEAGYRNIATHYPASQPDSTSNSLRVYSEVTQALNKTSAFKFWAEYIPTLSSNLTGNPGYQASQDYQGNAEASVTSLLNDIFSLKAAYLFKYKNYLPPTSPATKYLDTLFTTSLVAKF